MRLYLVAYTAPDGITLEAYPVLPRTDVPPLSGAVETLATVTGWPFQVVQHDAQLTARYEVLVYAAVVVVRAPSAATLAARRTEIAELLAGARVDLSGEAPAAISELWEI